MARRSLFAAVVGALALLLASEGPCWAAGRTVTWTVTRSTDASVCPDGAALAAAVAKARGPEPANEDAAQRPVELDVTFSRADTGFAATVRARGGASGVRTLADAGPTCAALADAVVATVAVLLDTASDEPVAPAPAPPPVAARPEPPPENENGGGSYSALRIGLAAQLGVAYFHRSSTDPSGMEGAVIGGMLRVHPHSQHGVAFSAAYGGGVFGPNVALIEPSYSLALGDPHPLNGVSGIAHLEVGPSLGLVTQAGPAPDHKVFGGHAVVLADLQLAYFTLGFDVGYRGGIPLGGPKDGWEGAFIAGLHAGLVLDFDAHEGGSTP